jgi:aryl-phospho-beta-D-glucosidase BglC (GH1 family)
MKKLYGFNLQWMYSVSQLLDTLKNTHIQGSIQPGSKLTKETTKALLQIIQPDLKALNFMQEMDVNFIRLPLDYRFWIHNFEYDKPHTAFLEKLDECIEAIISRGFHCSLNLHRAPGYCINGNNEELHNLWLDKIAQDAFVLQWENFARRYKKYSADQLDFDLLNEPPDINQYGMNRENHSAIILRAADAIRAISPDRPITINGLGGGNIALPELAHAGFRMSTRGYQPMAISHYEASWCAETQGLDYPKYPFTNYANKIWTIDTIRKHYAPWKELAEKQVPIHIGEFGCYNKIDNAIALRWFQDLFTVFNELGWGYALWQFEGAFGIVNHGRPNTQYKKIDGYEVDIQLYELFKRGMK